MDSMDPKLYQLVYTVIIGALSTGIMTLLGVVGFWIIRYLNSNDAAIKTLSEDVKGSLQEIKSRFENFQSEAVTQENCRESHKKMEDRLTEGNSQFDKLDQKYETILAAVTVLAEGIVSMMSTEQKNENSAVLDLKNRLRARRIKQISS